MTARPGMPTRPTAAAPVAAAVPPTPHPGRRGRLGWSTALWLAVRGGRADRLRIALTALGAAGGTVALLAAATVGWTRADDGPYSSDLLTQPGLHPGIVIALVLLCLPLLGFVGQCARVGAPDRDRRLAAVRLAGATPRDVVRIASGESALAAGLGSLVGLATYLVLRVALDTPVGYEETSVGRHPRAVLRLPTDVLPPRWVLAAIVVAVPVGAVAATTLALRRVTVGPFGLSRREHPRPPRALPAALFVVGAAGLAVCRVVLVVGGRHGWSVPALGLGAVVVLLVALAGAGLVSGSAALAALIGRLVAPRTGRPALLIAARRLVAAPFDASRAHAAVLLTVLLAAGAEGVRANFLAATDPADPFFRDAFHVVDIGVTVAVVLGVLGLLVGAAEGIVTRRRSLASLAAAGAPRGVLGRAVLLQALLPLVPGVVVAAAAGVLGARGVLGTTVETTYGPAGADGTTIQRVVGVPVPWQHLVVLVGGTVALTVVVTALALVFLRRSVDPRELHVPV